MKKYEHGRIEKKWQKHWVSRKLYQTKDSAPGKKNFYLLTEFPYPSGNLHVGHWYAFAVPDIYARFERMRGKNVMYPIGFDAFGLPAENAAIKNKLNPRVWTYGNIARMKKQIASMGASFDWSREVATCDPEYYKWTQWMFLQFYKNGLAYRKNTPANWCPSCKTVLANEQVVDGTCERCGSEVVQKEMMQWNLRISRYADRLIDDLDGLDWPNQIKESQKNWIGRSEGAEIDFPLKEAGIKRIILLHGKGGSPAGGFKPWLKQELEKRGYEVEIPSLPQSDEPDDAVQADYVMKHCTLDEHTAIVGHSFGGIVALRLLERGVRLARVTLVATPLSGTYLDRKKRPTVTAAVRKGFDFDAIRAHCGGFVAVYDMNDHIVPMSDGEQYAAALGCMLIKGTGSESHFNGAIERDVLIATVPSIRVFTTRPDTLFGATYLVLAPEHPWVSRALDHATVIRNQDDVAAYIAATSRKSDLERQENKEKTGIVLEGVVALNPATGEEIPVFIADYVLPHYGTGAIMAVPAHDERDLEFAQVFGLPRRQVVARVSRQTSGVDAVQDGEPWREKRAVMCIVKHWAEDSYLCLKWKSHPDIRTFVSGGIEEGESPIEAGLREIREETGYRDVKFVRECGNESIVEFYHQLKKQNSRLHFSYLYFELGSDAQDEVSEEETQKHDVLWKTESDVCDFLSIMERDAVWGGFKKPERAYDGDGVLVNSGPYTGLSNVAAKEQITAVFGERKRTYRLRDWIVSRQRYWGVPIPIIRCSRCGDVPVPDSQLPVKLPEVKDYLPEGTGKSPLAKATKWVKVRCPKCRETAERETDTLDTFVDSSWYFARYADPRNKKVFAEKKRLSAWLPVDLYSGGAEHTTMHLLYSRFWHKALYDLKLVKESEPYIKRMNRSLIMGPDGQKMSKSKGNVIDPDEVVARLGADTVRMYLAFIGPYNEVASYPWNPDGVVGVRRFIERVWRLADKAGEKTDPRVQKALHQAIAKASEEIPALKFNTAIAALMTFMNAAEGQALSKKDFGTFLKLLAPFAPHVSEELWSNLGNKKSIHLERWPKADPKQLVSETVTVAIQINGKTRGTVEVPSSADEKEVLRLASLVPLIAKYLEGQTIRRTIFVPQRLLNIVV